MFERELDALAKRLRLSESDRKAIEELMQRAAGATAKTLLLEEPEPVDASATTELFDRGRLRAGDAEPPTVDEDRYEDLGLIASGGMGDVRRVRDTVLNRSVALKVLRKELETGHQIARFIEEAQTTAQLQHPNVVPVHELGRMPDGRYFFTMKEVRGQTLTQVIREVHEASVGGEWVMTSSGWSFRKLVDAFQKACLAVAYAHDRGVVHRDLKPDNVMVGAYGEVQVMDWGLAKVVDEDTADPLQLRGNRSPTRQGKIAGTPSYMSPEQAYGEPTTLASDVYSLGAVLYEILAGHPPYVAADPREVVRQLRRGDPPLPLGRVVDQISFSETRGFTQSDLGSRGARKAAPLPRDLVKIVERAMARDPMNRYADALGVAEDVRNWLDGENRSDQALETVEQARARFPEASRLRDEAAGLRARATAILGEVPKWAPDDQKEEAWALEDKAADLEREADLLELDAEGMLRGAITYVQGFAAAHAAMAERLRLAHHHAEAGGDLRGAQRIEVPLRAHVAALPEEHLLRKELQLYLKGDGAISIATEPPGAEVHLYRYVTTARRLDPVAGGVLGTTPFSRLRLAMGSYLLVLKAPGRADVRYPVLLDRQGRWSGVPPGEIDIQPIVIPPELPQDECYVPAGWARVGGDEAGLRRAWIDGFVIQRFPITNGRYLDFLNDLLASGRAGEAERRVPCERRGASAFRLDGGRYVLGADEDGDRWQPDWPVMQVDCASATAYGAWWAARTGQPWRLPSVWEWEKAARGVDGRSYPWGEQEEHSWACTLYSHRERPSVCPIDAFPDDESPYGVRGCAGGVMDWCLETAGDLPPGNGERLVVPANPLLLPDGRVGEPETGRYRATRGGTWMRNVRLGKCGISMGVPEHARSAELGFRLVRSYP